MRVGSEFVHLCQEQVNLLTCGLGASLAIVALLERPAQQLEEDTITFLPVLTYPEAFDNVDPQALRLWLVDIWLAEQNKPSSVSYENRTSPRTNGASMHPDHQDEFYTDEVFIQSRIPATNQNTTVVTIADGTLGPHMPLVTSKQNQIVMPLIYQEVMVGLLVTARGDRGWNQLEKYDVERVGQTLAAACVLEQRSQWLEQRLHQQTAAYTQIHDRQQDVLDDVLHQFRNPLTALRTFGKLLIKRLQPSDRNRTVAESIVRESDRLQDLLKQLSAAAEISSIALPSVESTMPTASTHTTVLIPSSTEVSASDSLTSETNILRVEATSIVNPGGDEGTTASDEMTVNETTTVLVPIAEPDPVDPVKALTGQAIQIHSVDPMEILGPLLLSANAIAQEHQIELCVTCPEHHGAILADAKAFREVCSNLIDNALKYTPTPGRIDILVGIVLNRSTLGLAEERTEMDDRSMQGLVIADTGPGIPGPDQARLFERHFRGVQSQGNIPGTGLGLAIAQLLTQQMGGLIQVFSPIAACPLDEIKTVLYQARQVPMSDNAEHDVMPLSTQSGPREPETGQSGTDRLGTKWPGTKRPGTIFIVWLPTP